MVLVVWAKYFSSDFSRQGSCPALPIPRFSLSTFVSVLDIVIIVGKHYSMYILSEFNIDENVWRIYGCRVFTVLCDFTVCMPMSRYALLEHTSLYIQKGDLI